MLLGLSLHRWPCTPYCKLTAIHLPMTLSTVTKREGGGKYQNRVGWLRTSQKRLERTGHLTKPSTLGNAETKLGRAGWTSHSSINKRTIPSFILGCDRSPAHSRNPKRESKPAAESFSLRGRRCVDGSIGLSGGPVTASANCYSCNGIYGEPPMRVLRYCSNTRI